MLQKKNYSKSEQRSLINKIKRGGKGGQMAIETIYKDFRYMVYLKKLTKEFNLPSSEASDFFHDAILIFRKNVRNNKFDSDSNIQSYLTNVVKNLIQNKKRTKQFTELTEAINLPSLVEESVAENYTRKESREQVNQLLSKLTSTCKRILIMWQEGYSYDEIAESMHLKNKDYARKNKFNCMKKLMTHVSSFPQLKTFLS